MLGRNNRLTRQRDFERVFKQGQGFASEHFFLKTVSNNLEQSRFGIIVSNKVCKKAVTRNKLKRRLREIIREQVKQENIKKGIDIVVSARPGLEQDDFSQIRENLIQLFKKAKIYGSF